MNIMPSEESIGINSRPVYKQARIDSEPSSNPDNDIEDNPVDIDEKL